MLQVAVAPGAERLEVRGEREQLIARRDVDDFGVERDAAQSAVPAATLPVDPIVFQSSSCAARWLSKSTTYTPP
jgi:hypothetical protein